ncbi:MAG: carboxypeptidase-like regulatory domain-containing protein [Robiginitalea sp.]
MKAFQFFILSVGLLMISGLHAQEIRTIKGSVSDGQNPMKDVRIQVQGREIQTFTNAGGKYEIQAAAGDFLKYSYTGMKDYIVRVEDVTRFLNLIMIPDVEELSEVTVTGSHRKSQQDLAIEYPTNPRIIRTAFGYLNADTAPGRVSLLSEEDINPVGLCILNVIRNRFAGVRTTGDCQQGGDIIIRGPGSVSNQRVAVYDVDGLILRDAPIWLDINQIKRIAIVSSVAYSSRYGALGNGGVIIINTLAGNPQDPKLKDLARLRNNYYKGDALREAQVQKDLPTYLTELNGTTSYEAALEVYNAHEGRYRSSPYFFLDSYRHFYDRLGEEAFASEIIESNFSRFEGNAVLMKALAYLYQEQGRHREALELYKEIFILRPHYSQSYMDLANAYRDVSQYDKAARMFFRYKYLVDENFLVASDNFSKIVQHESDNLLKLHVRDVGVNIDKILTDPYVDNTTRVVVEWNDTEAEFELQFVNPEGQYHTWKHTYAENDKRLLDEKMKGYSAEEQIIDRALPGQWTINARYLGNKSLTPTYLKVTTYYNYGERDQQKRVQAFKLSVRDVWQELLTLNNPGISRVR